jgi:uncharacterized protein YndB with AHSA1/START domain
MKPEPPFELSVSRSIAAPPARVWRIMTEHLEQWWCPSPWRVSIDAIDWRPGGRFDTTMHGPDGEIIASRGLFLEVTPHRRLVFTDAINADWQPQEAFMIGLMELEAEGRGTRYRGSARHWRLGAMEKHRQMGFEEGWRAVADQLAALAEAT